MFEPHSTELKIVLAIVVAAMLFIGGLFVYHNLNGDHNNTTEPVKEMHKYGYKYSTHIQGYDGDATEYVFTIDYKDIGHGTLWDLNGETGIVKVVLTVSRFSDVKEYVKYIAIQSHYDTKTQVISSWTSAYFKVVVPTGYSIDLTVDGSPWNIEMVRV